jgi:hypothetical protein
MQDGLKRQSENNLLVSQNNSKYSKPTPGSGFEDFECLVCFGLF